MDEVQQNKVDINDERSVRLQKLKDLEMSGMPGFPARVKRTATVKEAVSAPDGQKFTIVGRLRLKREIGKIAFATIEDESGRGQLVLRKDDLGDSFSLFVKKIDVGDIVEAEGERMVSKTGEPSLLVLRWRLLAKSLRPLPDKFHGLADEETRVRKRYLDFLANPEAREKIVTRSRLVRALRDFMHGEGFMEVENPVLETVASGAMAKTFDTHLNAFDLPVHLRIALEVPQKKLLVAGFEKIFEIGRCFRNEGVDFQHNPEFTQIEYYMAYADYEDNIRFHEKLLPKIIAEAVGTLKIKNGEHELDFTPPYPRAYFRDLVLEHSGIDLDIFDTKEKLMSEMRKRGYETEDGASFGKLADELYKSTARAKIIQPTFVLNYPTELKPLAKLAENPKYTEMFQLVVLGMELSNSYTELNDPIDQRARFVEQEKNRAEGDEEAMAGDEDFLEALEYAMPPSTGTGIGIDRLAALISGAHSLREVIVFPTVRPELNK